jgi:predicted amidohydrolase
VKIKVAIAQIKPRKGDYEHNLRRVGELFEQIEADAPDTDILVLPETVLSGYFLEGAVREVARTREQLTADILGAYRAAVRRPDAVLDCCLGFYELGDGRYYNSAAYLTLTATDTDASGERLALSVEKPAANAVGTDPAAQCLAPSAQRLTLNAQRLGTNALLHVHRKFFLPTYGVFDEKRFVSRGRAIRTFETRFGTAAILICEDAWHSISATIAALKGAQMILIPSASPGREFNGQHLGNVARWNVLLPGIADEHNVWVIYAGLVGFEGGKGFTGSSQVIDPWGNCLVLGSDREECLVCATLDLDDVATARAASPLLADLDAALGDISLEIEQIARRQI